MKRLGIAISGALISASAAFSSALPAQAYDPCTGYQHYTVNTATTQHRTCLSIARTNGYSVAAAQTDGYVENGIRQNYRGRVYLFDNAGRTVGDSGNMDQIGVTSFRFPLTVTITNTSIMPVRAQGKTGIQAGTGGRYEWYWTGITTFRS